MQRKANIMTESVERGVRGEGNRINSYENKENKEEQVKIGWHKNPKQKKKDKEETLEISKKRKKDPRG
eukprot:GDKH01027480.1.p1 GENE.GDKH01027480.1~~GDKH01027480.1.p1  ORF type:complete len:68 (-),score=9.14 GDKH01027480.1:39-242(-)